MRLFHGIDVALAVMAVLASASRSPAAEEKVSFGRFGTVVLYHETPHPSQVVLFVSGDGGWNLGVVNMASQLASLDALVAGIDITHYIKKLENSGEACSYPAGDFEELSRFIQQELDYPSHVTPILVGYSSGATLVYAILVQAPTATFLGAMSLGFCPDLPTQKPFCVGSGLQWGPGPHGKGVSFLPARTLEVPWYVLQGDVDQVCDTPSTVAFVHETRQGHLLELPKVGHGFSVPRNWMPQFKEAYARIIHPASPPDSSASPEDSSRSAAPSDSLASGELAGLPLIEVPASNPPADSIHDLLAVHFTGDGGWGVTDKGLGAALALKGVPVVAVNCLRYFWKKKTPEEASQDLDRILRHYLVKWGKERVVLIGYSFGADVLPFLLNRLSRDLQARVPLVVLLGPDPNAEFGFHLTDWLGGQRRAESQPVIPEVGRIERARVLCFYGRDDPNAICKNLDPRRVTSILLEGGHRIGHRFDGLAESILKAVR